MIGWVNSLRQSQSGAAAAELALSLPLMLILLFGSVEAGNYFYSEHKLVESVRDGARWASRQNFSDYPCTGSIDAGTEDDIEEVIRTGRVGGSDDRLPLMDNADDGGTATYSITYVCTNQMETKPGSGSYVPVGGLYNNMGQAPIVTVDVQVPYQSLFGFEYGFPAGGIWLNAEQQTTVNGV